MKRAHALVLLLAAAVPLAAQAQLRQPPSPTETRPVSLPQPSKSNDDKAGERTQRDEPPTVGKPQASTPRPITRPAAQRPVYDAHGQRMNGMRQAGANRVMDTRTGRYYDTVPSGDGQRIVKQDDGSP
ncbi:classical arabinogalactan protein 4 [Stenotrophomonas sp. NLF4-10]|uniref:classical arabinogalactan protein 4 n=1 Tax=Stenotrophomonas sp. NLF4-10 TaxID=2918754 RepID=UPI001EFAF4F9|nr:classical arabinogalactan protein 4 [Stenotrophomonas sp. NLF4-10]MCG8275507.1 classical arabinogalactan protein 4 [Stenotrophomonas sp. NLF4-10]